MPPEHQPFSGDFDFVHNEDLKILPQSMGGGNNFSLEETYMTYDVRESYLQRQANPLANQANSIIINKEEYETKTCNIWRSNDSGKVYASDPSSTALDFYTGDYSIADKVSVI